MRSSLLLVLTPFLFLGLFYAAPAHAQGDEQVMAGKALTQAVCERMRDQVWGRIERYTRMKFRRPIPVGVEPEGVWRNKLKRKGFGGMAARHALAFYTPGRNRITVVPWVIGRYASKSPLLKTRGEWIAELEPTMIHELTHGIHHHNFYSEGRLYRASLKPSGLTEYELDRSTVAFLLGEGVPELVSLRTTEFPERMDRKPSMEMPAPLNYVKRYKPDGKQAYRQILMRFGYNDGLDISYHIAKAAGPRGIRAMLYRSPPRILLYQPNILATVELDDPPEPDSIFGYLAPVRKLAGGEIRRAVNPGKGRYFNSDRGLRAEGCLLGYTAATGSTDSPTGVGRYSFFVADPDRDAPWIADVVEGVKEINLATTTEKTVTLPLTKGVKARLITVKGDNGGLYVYAETRGLVVMAHETKPTDRLIDRVVGALRALYIKAPKKGIYDEAVKKAKKALKGG